ncbi:MAG: hypothetical protein OEU36_07005 [Gammaproteobacteria bacterium]|nr:hypothetical protein [Gammaproteobacteria bacterium]
MEFVLAFQPGCEREGEIIPDDWIGERHQRSLIIERRLFSSAMVRQPDAAGHGYTVRPDPIGIQALVAIRRLTIFADLSATANQEGTRFRSRLCAELLARFL